MFRSKNILLTILVISLSSIPTFAEQRGIEFTPFALFSSDQSKMNNLQVGMSKQEAIAIMGYPSSISAMNGTEYLKYTLVRDKYWASLILTLFLGVYVTYDQYFIRIIGNKVDSFGVWGDFDSTKDPTLRLNINSN